MVSYVVYLKLELKRVIKLLPNLLLGMLGLGLLIVLVSFCIEKLVTSQEKDKKTIITYAVEDDSILSNIVVDMLKDSSGVTGVSDFVKTDRDTAIRLAAKGDALAAIIVPKGFMDSLFSGENYSILVSMNRNINLYTAILIEMSYATERVLNTAQAGSFSMQKIFEGNGIKKYDSDLFIQMDKIYLSKAFAREEVYNLRDVSSDEVMSLKEYYVCGGIVLLMMFMGLLFVRYVRGDSKAIQIKLNQRGIGYIRIIFAKILSLSMVYFGMLMIGTILYRLYGGIKCDIHILLTASAFAAMVTASLVVMLISMASSDNAAILLVFIVSIILAYISGCFVPEVMLPGSIRTINSFLPTRNVMHVIAGIYKNSIPVRHIVYGFVSFILCMLLAAVCRMFELRKKMQG